MINKTWNTETYTAIKGIITARKEQVEREAGEAVEAILSGDLQTTDDAETLLQQVKHCDYTAAALKDLLEDIHKVYNDQRVSLALGLDLDLAHLLVNIGLNRSNYALAPFFIHTDNVVTTTMLYQVAVTFDDADKGPMPKGNPADILCKIGRLKAAGLVQTTPSPNVVWLTEEGVEVLFTLHDMGAINLPKR